jgi:hypothetical protein
MALWTPDQITTALWLDASDASTLFDATTGGSAPADGGGVARWEDKSGNGYHATQGTSGNQPTRETTELNGLDVVRFNGSSDTMSGSHLLIPDAQSGCLILIVALSTTTNTQQRLLTIASSGDGEMQFFQRYSSTSKLETFGRGVSAENTSVQTSNNATGAWKLLASQFNSVAGRVQAAINAASFASADRGSAFTSTAPTRYQLGAFTTSISTLQHLNGDLAEVIVLDSVPSTAGRQLIEGYLAWKWGLEGDLPAGHPYENAAPTIGVKDNRRRRYAGGYGL